jgi:hypothetical protein
MESNYGFWMHSFVVCDDSYKIKIRDVRNDMWENEIFIYLF